MAKKIITVTLICILLFTTFVVPSFAFFNGYLAQGEGTAMLWLPVYDTYAIDMDYLPVNFYDWTNVNKPFLLFNTFSTMEITGDADENVYYFQDDTMSAPQGYVYGLSILDLSNDYYPDVSLAVINFAINLYRVEDGVLIFSDTELEMYGLEDPQPVSITYVYITDIISDPTDVSDFFAYMYPFLPLTWTDYSKIVNGTYQSGFADGERKGRDKINLSAVQDAFERGKAQGFDEGYNEGFYDAGGKNYFKELVDAVIFAPVNGIVEMMNFDFFGINVANFFLALLTILILAGILALIARFIL